MTSKGARPIFAGERLTWVKPGQRLAYSLSKFRPDGQIVLYLTPFGSGSTG